MLLLKVPVQVAVPVVGSGFGCAGVQVASASSDTPSDEDTSAEAARSQDFRRFTARHPSLFHRSQLAKHRTQLRQELPVGVEKANATLPFLMAVAFRQRNRQQYPSGYRHFMGPDPSAAALLALVVQVALVGQVAVVQVALFHQRARRSRRSGLALKTCPRVRQATRAAITSTACMSIFLVGAFFRMGAHPSMFRHGTTNQLSLRNNVVRP